ncbi:MAG: DNA-processing protein DprA [Actinomycetes bacterium]
MTGLSPDTAARILLSQVCEPGDPVMGALVRAAGAPGALELVQGSATAGTPEVQGRLEAYRRRWQGVSTRDPGLLVGSVADQQVTVVTPECPGWPRALDDLGARAPLLLWWRGREPSPVYTARAVAVVGARAATAYGTHVAGELAADLGARGVLVVSGAAYGVDAAAHRGSLAVGAPTVAVLACGVERAYPTGNAALLDRVVAESGAVVSELPPGSHPTRLRFLERNRVIAALARGVVVVEAAARSGSLRTLREAAELGRVTMAIPGPVTSAMSVGAHEAVRTGQAQLVTGAQDVLDLVGALGEHVSDERRAPPMLRDQLDRDSALVLEAMPTDRSVGPAGLVAITGLTPVQVIGALGVLSALGLVRTRPEGWRLTTAALGG